MQSIKNSILWHVRGRSSAKTWLFAENGNVLKQLSSSKMFASTTGTHTDQTMDRVIGLVKKFDKIDATKKTIDLPLSRNKNMNKNFVTLPEQVTETADFQKDLSLDSLDRVELVMAFEQEFSIEIPDEKADKLTCCADVAKYIVSGAEQNMKS
ncbi:hypothetical protein FEM48_Zijuj01G0087500 [Ziziphus jujuba var. spinosa]|uniref:Acyl carrier protein n=1 Tax=Ziziphus jujuba var. spinosa TaxID=714518 RepID=A0A978W097_ZIZJJ|nr:hypothetical protein FEM48_Zijuj01G0087500 [Ziziphus jujuba var. spinosa]